MATQHRLLILGAFALVLMSCAVLRGTPAHAIFYNDSNVIEIGDGVPPGPGESSGGGYAQGNYGGPGYGQSGYGSGEINYGYDFSGGGGTGAGTSTEDTPGASQESGGEPGPSDEELEDEIVSILGGSGGYVGSGASGNSGVSGAGWFPGWFSGAVGASLQGESVIAIIGESVREALRQEYDLKDLLLRFDASLQGRTPGLREYGLLGASSALKDQNIAGVAFTDTRFEITYRARGYLFGLFPKSYPVRLTITPAGGSEIERVAIKLPWYRFFVRKFFTVSVMRQEIDEVVVTARDGVTDASSDVKAAVFSAVTEFLKRKVGTIGDSIILGTNPKKN